MPDVDHGDSASVGGWEGRSAVSTEDVDRARRILDANYLPVRLDLGRDRVAFQARLDVAPLGTTTVGQLSFRADVQVTTEVLGDYHVNVPVSGQAWSRIGRRDELVTSAGSGVVFSPGEPVEVRWRRPLRQVCVKLNADLLHGELEALLGHGVTRPVVFVPAMKRQGPAVQTWMHAVDLVRHQLGRPDGMLNHVLARHRLGQMMVQALLHGQPHTYSDELGQAGSGREGPSVRRALELMQTYPGQPWTLSELAGRTGLSGRALQAGIRRVTGMTPMAYVREVRLREAHEELRGADPATTSVALVAHRWGFTHLGRFAAAYRQRFDELPSETLRR